MFFDTLISLGIYLGLAILYIFSLPLLGKLNFISKRFYCNIVFIDDFFSREQYLFWILLFPFALWIASIVFYFLGVEFLVPNLWLSVFFFWIILFFYIVVLLERGLLLSKKDFLLISILSSFTTLAFNVFFYKRGLEFLLPPNNIEWFWIPLFGFIIFSVWESRRRHIVINSKHEKRIELYIDRKLEEFKEKYGDLFKNLNKEQRELLLAILIVENYNRPRFIRFVERIFSFTGLIKSTGIAQFSNKRLTDRESVDALRKEIIRRCGKKIDLETVISFLNFYNGKNYYKIVLRTIELLKKRKI